MALAAWIFHGASTWLEWWLGAHAVYIVVVKILSPNGGGRRFFRTLNTSAHAFAELLTVISRDAVTLSRQPLAGSRSPVASVVFCVILLLNACFFFVTHHFALFTVLTHIVREVNDAPESAAAGGGLDKAVLDTVSNLFSFEPTAEQAADSASAPEACSICLVDYDRGDQVRAFNGCVHRFHAECIDKWLERSSHCPLCRADFSSSAAPPPRGAAAASGAAAETAQGDSGPVVNNVAATASSPRSRSRSLPRRARSGRSRSERRARHDTGAAAAT